LLYETYINHSELWQEKRRKRLDIDKYECRICGDKERLQVHHKPPSYKKIPNESVEDDLTTLCEDCHEVVTDLLRRRRYGNKPIVAKPHVNPLTTRKVGDNNVNVEQIKIQAHRGLPPHRPQREAVEPAGLLLKGVEEDFRQEVQDGC